MKKYLLIIMALTLSALLLTGCSSTNYSATINLDGTTATVTGDGASVKDSTVTISSAGTYKINGTLTDGQIVVDANGAVTLALEGASVTNTADDAIHIKSGTVTVQLADGTKNTLTSGTAAAAKTETDTEATAAPTTTAAVQADTAANTTVTTETPQITDAGTDTDAAAADDASGAALFSKEAITITGTGELTVNGYINNGVAAKGGVTVTSGTLTVSSANDGVKSSDGDVTVSGGTLKITSGGDGISAGGKMNISAGTFDITSGDGSESQTNVQGQGGMTRPTGTDGQVLQQPQTSGEPDAQGGSMPAAPSGQLMPGDDTGTDDTDDSASMKAIKSDGAMTISGGTFTINSTDHAIHSKDAISITGGTLNIASSAGKGISGHGNVTIDGEKTAVTITKSTEGIESKAILTINNGTVKITASDDGMNAGGGSSGFGGFGKGAATTAATTAEPETTAASEIHALIINGGSVYVNAVGDGLDSNGDLTITGGTVIVDGPTSGGDGAIDSGSESGGKCSVTGGTVIAVGSSAMAEGFDENSTQYSFMYNFDSTIKAGTEIKITDGDGNLVYTYTPTKDFQSVVFSSSKLQKDASYTVSAGESTATIEMSSIAVNSQSANAMGGHGGMNGTKPTMPTDGSFDPSQMHGGKGGKDAATGATANSGTATTQTTQQVS